MTTVPGLHEHRRVDPRPVVLALGSNLGDRMGLLREAVAGLAALDGMTVESVSPVYETVPVGGPPQGEYLNAVVLGVTELSRLALLTRALRLEALAGRVRTQPMGPRTLDIDVITVGGEVFSDTVLTLPHPRAHERAFVLVPWLDADPAAVLPGKGAVADLVRQLPVDAVAGVRRYSDELTPA